MTIAAVSSRGSLPLLRSAFQLACSSAANKTARATLSVIASSLANPPARGIVGRRERNRGSESFARKIDRISATVDPRLIREAVGTRYHSERDRFAERMAKSSRRDEAHRNTVAQNELVTPEIALRSVD